MPIKNKKVFFFALIALVCIALTFLVHRAFIIGAIILMILNQRELFKNPNKNANAKVKLSSKNKQNKKIKN